MAHGIKISKELYDAKNCDDRDLVINSDLPSLKVFSHGEFSATLPANETSETIIITIHNLGYKPMFLVFCDNGEGQRYPFSSGVGEIGFISLVTSTQLKVRLYVMGTENIKGYNRTFYGHYYIFHNPM